MEYQDFLEQVKEHIKEFLPKEFADAKVSIDQIVKNNDCIMDGMTIQTEESNIFPTIYLNPYYEMVQEEEEIGMALFMIAAAYRENYINYGIDMSDIMDYDSIKDKIVCKLINAEANGQFLQNKPYTQIEDLAVVYQIVMDKGRDATATVTISDSLMERYGVTPEQLHEQALENMETLQPYSFKSMYETVTEIVAENIAKEKDVDQETAKEMAEQMMPVIPDTMYVLTNDTKINGASEIIRDDVRQEIADKIGDFYVLPSSVHETLIIPKSAGMDRQELEQIVQEVNQTEVAPQELLSDHVYEYDAKEHELFRSDRAEERKEQKEKRQEEKQDRPSLKSRLAEKQNTVVQMDEGRKQHSSEKKMEAAI